MEYVPQKLSLKSHENYPSHRSGWSPIDPKQWLISRRSHTVTGEHLHQTSPQRTAPPCPLLSLPFPFPPPPPPPHLPSDESASTAPVVTGSSFPSPYSSLDPPPPPPIDSTASNTYPEIRQQPNATTVHSSRSAPFPTPAPSPLLPPPPLLPSQSDSSDFSGRCSTRFVLKMHSVVMLDAHRRWWFGFRKKNKTTLRILTSFYTL
ncbi:Uncharacterized protein Rs2_16093 [Raphanus sativus]|nr:Uncharacterized protein Rs2_16093 [Raphanus sativus]